MARSGPSGTVSRPRAPIEEPTNPAANPSAARSQSSDSSCQYEATEVKAPKTACALLVPIAICGGRPAASRAGRGHQASAPGDRVDQPADRPRRRTGGRLRLGRARGQQADPYGRREYPSSAVLTNGARSGLSPAVSSLPWAVRHPTLRVYDYKESVTG